MSNHSFRSASSLRPSLLGAAALLAALPGASAAAADGGDDPGSWPYWRGPRRDAVSTETGWSLTGKASPLWKANVGLGYSSVSIHDGRLYTMGHDRDEDRDTVYCMDPETGKVLWTHSYPSATLAKMHSGGTLTTPSVDPEEGVVYTANREGKSFCLDAETGKVRWSRDLKEELGSSCPRGASPPRRSSWTTWWSSTTARPWR